jgi:hypothetical protein
VRTDPSIPVCVPISIRASVLIAIQVPELVDKKDSGVVLQWQRAYYRDQEVPSEAGARVARWLNYRRYRGIFH